MMGLFNHIGARWGVSTAYRVIGWLPWVALLIGSAAGAALGWSQGRAPLHVELAELRTSHAQASALQAQAQASALQAAQARGDQLSQRLVRSDRLRRQLTQEKEYALAQATIGRACLDGAALRVLHAAPGLSVEHADRLPAATGEPAAAHAAIAPYSSDRDIGGWAIVAGAQYEACRERLQALIDWHDGATPASTSTAP